MSGVSKRSQAKELVFGDMKFKNKTTALKYFSNYINPKDKTTPTINKNDVSMFDDLLSFHPRAHEFNNGYVGIRKDPIYKTNNQLYFHHNDSNTDEEFSYKVCINGYNDNGLRTKWFRNAIRPDIELFKANNKPPKYCPCCHKQTNDFEVDHDKKRFRELLSDFLKIKGIEMQSLNVNHNCKIDEIINDKELEREWKNYHSKNCHLQYLCHNCNSIKH